MSSTPELLESGKHFIERGKIIILKVFNKFCDKFPTIFVKDNEQLALNFNYVSAYNITNTKN